MTVYAMDGTVTLDTGTRGGFRIRVSAEGEVERQSWVIQHSGREPLGQAEPRIDRVVRDIPMYIIARRAVPEKGGEWRHG